MLASASAQCGTDPSGPIELGLQALWRTPTPEISLMPFTFKLRHFSGDLRAAFNSLALQSLPVERFPKHKFSSIASIFSWKMCHLVDQAIKPPILLAGPLAPRSRKSRRGPLFSWTWSCGDRVNKACFIWILAQKEVVTRKKPTSVFQIEKMHWPIDALKIVNGENDALHNQSKSG